MGGSAGHAHPLGAASALVGSLRAGPGDRVFFEPRENHWPYAAPDRFMAQTAMPPNDDPGSARRI